MKKILIFLIFFLFLGYFSKASAINQYDVLINEIAWMGSTNSANDEWIELYNNTNNNIDLSGWTLKSADEKLKINLNGIITEKGFYLLERTDNSSVSNIIADLIYKGALNNSGIDLALYDNSNNLIDKINCSMGWLAGDNTTKKTMERATLGWQTSKDINGTPRSENSIGEIKKTLDTTKTKIISQTTVLSEQKKFDNTKDISTAALSQFQNQEKDNQLSPWLLFLISLSVIIILAIIILLFNLKFLKKHERT